MASELEVGDVKATNKVVVTKNQQSTTGTPYSGAAIKALPANTTNTTGVSSIALGTSTVDKFGYLISAHRAGSDGTPTLRFSSHNNSDTGTEVLTISSTGLATFSSGINLGDDTLSNYKLATWTPTLSKGSTDITSPHANTGGRYVRIGKSLFISFYYYKGSAATTTGTDAWTLGGLPFTLQAGTPYQSISCGYVRIQSTSYEYTSPYRWQVNSSDGTKLDLRGAQRTTNNTGGDVEFSGFGVFEIA